MLSVFGDRAMFLALGVWVKTITGSSAAAGLVFFAYSLPGLVSPLFGGAVDWLFYSAQAAYLTRLLPAELLGDANAVLQTTGEGMRLFAPLVGAGLFAAFGGPTVAALDAATFLLAALTLVAIRHRERRPVPSEHHLRAQVAAGARHIARSAGLRRIVLTTAIVLLVVGFSET